MSSIPNAKMKHAHVHEGDDHEESGKRQDAAPGSSQGAQAAIGEPKSSKQDGGAKAGSSLGGRAKRIGGRIEDLAEDAVDAVKERPKTAAAIGAAMLAGAAALIGGPEIAKACKVEPPKKKPVAKKKPSAKKG